MKMAMSRLLGTASTIGLALAIFAMLTLGVEFCLAVASPSATLAGAHTYPHPSYAYATPDPHP